MKERSALVVGGGRGLGRGVVGALVAQGSRVTALARNREELGVVKAETGVRILERDAAHPDTAPAILRELRPDLLVIVAGASPVLRPLTEQTWDTFSRNWEVDTRIAFEWLRATLTTPLASGSHVIVFSSGAAVAGSPLSGGYAGAKRMQWFLTEYALAEAGRAGLDIRFHCLVPALTPSTELGRDAVAAYAARAGVSVEEYARRFSPALTAQGAGAAVVQLARSPGDWPDLAYRLGGAGLRAV